MNLSKALYGLDALGRGFSVTDAPAPTTSVGDVTLTFVGAANDLSAAHNDGAYRPHLVDRREARRRRRDVRSA